MILRNFIEIAHLSCSPTTTWYLLTVLSSRQCAAVNTHWGESNEPPQINPLLLYIATCHGNSPFLVVVPPTIREVCTLWTLHCGLSIVIKKYRKEGIIQPKTFFFSSFTVYCRHRIKTNKVFIKKFI